MADRTIPCSNLRYEGDYIALQKEQKIYIIHYQQEFNEGDVLHGGKELIGEKIGAKLDRRSFFSAKSRCWKLWKG